MEIARGSVAGPIGQGGETIRKAGKRWGECNPAAPATPLPPRRLLFLLLLSSPVPLACGLASEMTQLAGSRLACSMGRALFIRHDHHTFFPIKFRQ